jgi:hypothetical protein
VSAPDSPAPVLRYGVPNPPGAVARVVEGPLDRGLVALFDEVVSAAFRVSSIECSDAWEALPAAAADRVNESVYEVGMALLGDRAFIEDVTCVLGDGPAEGDVLGAICDLHSAGELRLGSPMRSQLLAAGYACGSCSDPGCACQWPARRRFVG